MVLKKSHDTGVAGPDRMPPGKKKAFMRLFLGLWVFLASFLFMSTSASKLLTQVYSKTSPKAVFALHCTGGGVGALQLAFGTPGASSSLMEGSVPYSRSAMRTFLGNAAPFAVVDKDGFCEGTTAEAMARRSRQLPPSISWRTMALRRRPRRTSSVWHAQPAWPVSRLNEATTARSWLYPPTGARSAIRVCWTRICAPGRRRTTS